MESTPDSITFSDGSTIAIALETEWQAAFAEVKAAGRAPLSSDGLTHCECGVIFDTADEYDAYPGLCIICAAIQRSYEMENG